MSTTLQAWYPLRELADLNDVSGVNRHGVATNTLFRDGVEYVESLRSDRLFTFGALDRGFNQINVGVNLFEIPSSGEMTLLDTEVQDVYPYGATWNTCPGKVAYVCSPGILGSGATNDVQVLVMSVSDSAVVTDYRVHITRAQLATYYAGIGTHTPFIHTDCCFDMAGKLWVFVSVWNGSMTVPPAIIGLRLNAVGTVELGSAVSKTTIDGDTTSNNILSLIPDAGPGAPGPAFAGAFGAEVWVLYYSSTAAGGSSVGLLKFDAIGGFTNEILSTSAGGTIAESPSFYLSRSGASDVSMLVLHQLSYGGGVIALPYVMYADHWVTDSDTAINANPTRFRYLRSWGVEEDTYAEWIVESVHLDSHDALVSFLVVGFNGGAPLADAEAEALTLSILGVSSWAEAEATYGPSYSSFDTLAVYLFATGSDVQITTGLSLWDAGNYLTELESNGMPRSTLTVTQFFSDVRIGLTAGGMMMTPSTVAAVTNLVDDLPAWIGYFDGAAPTAAVIVIGLGGRPPAVWINRIVVA